MKNVHFYITLEVTAQLDGDFVKDKPENREKIRGKIVEYIQSAKRKLDYNCYLHSEHIMSIYDEKGKEL